MPFVIPILAAIGGLVASAGAAIGIGTGAAALSTGALAMIGLSTVMVGAQVIYGVVSRSLAKPSLSSLAYDSANHSVAVRQAAAARCVLYGKASIGGVITYIATTGLNAEYLHLVVTWCGHQIDSIEGIYFDDYLLAGIYPSGGSESGKYAGFLTVEHKLGAPGEAAFPGLISDTTGMSGAWTSAHRQDGCASTHFKLKWDATLFANGVPAIRAVIKGKVDILDPRDNSVGWSNNLALCLNDYLQQGKTANSAVYGLGALASEVHSDSIELAADLCDQDVALAGGGTEKRYTCNGFFDSSNSVGDVLKRMLGAGYGRLVWVGGRWTLYLGAWLGVAGSFTDDDLRGPLALTARLSRRDSFNGVKGVFVSPDNAWQATNFPARQSAAYIAEDSGFLGVNDQGFWLTGYGYVVNDAVLWGGRAYVCTVDHTASGDNEPGLGEHWADKWALCSEVAWKEVEYSFVTSQTQAQRLSKIELETGRRGATMAAPLKLQGYAVQPPEVIEFTHPHFGWSRKRWEVNHCTLAVNADGTMGADLTLRETDANVYAWDAAQDELPFQGSSVPALATRPDYYQTVSQNQLPPVGIANLNSAIVGGVSPLTGRDAGASAKVMVAAFAMQFAWGRVHYNSGVVLGLDYDTDYWITCDDPYLRGGALNFTAWLNYEDAVAAPGRVYVGGVKTPTAGGGDTGGHGGGGGGGGFKGL